MINRQKINIKNLRKDIIFKESLRGIEFFFHSTWGLFSPRKIDDGSRLLINNINIDENDDCFDLGCGYGAIGLAMAKLSPYGQTYLVDKDYVAVKFAKKNAVINGIENCSIFLSNGFSEIEKRDFNIIASNIPAKVGKELLYITLYDARKHLVKGGKLYIVTISGLKDFIKRNLINVFGNYRKIKQNKSYTLFLAHK